ncbi:MAG: hypothetical protein IJ571_05225 [Ruminococcus sp.]|nr:hypothetical protein [Ruminococcus sp.]
MNKMKRFHLITMAVTAVLYIGSLIWFLIAYKSLDDQIGIHFDSQDFDVYASKKFGFYPFVAGPVLTALLQLSRFLSDKLKESPKLTEEGNEKYRVLIKMYADILTLIIAVFFTSWNWAVIKQNSYYHCQYFYSGLMTFIPLMMIALPVFDIVYKHKYKDPDYKKRKKAQR